LLQAIKRERPDLIHAHWTYEFALAAIESGLPHLITAHDAPFQILRYDFTPYRFIRTLMAISVLHRAQALTAVSPHVAEHLGRFFRYRRRISVVPNGLWQDLFERHAERPRLAVTGQVTFATVLNGWGHLKNAETAIRAFAIVRAQMPSARMLMFGKGYGVGEVAQMWARQKGLDASIEFRGAQPYESMLEQLATEVDVLVHPSREESFCMVIAEAMALRVPVVAGSRSGAVPWILDQGTAGLLVDVRSQAQVAREMVALGRDPEYRRRVATVGWELASQRYTMGLVADQYVRCYQEILQTHAHGESVG
jgi:glycosyltransferase involved in cell wall biosynthesis